MHHIGSERRACASRLRALRPRSHQQRPGRLAAGDALVRALQHARTDAARRCVGAPARVARVLRRADAMAHAGADRDRLRPFPATGTADWLTIGGDRIMHGLGWQASWSRLLKGHRRCSAGVTVQGVGDPRHRSCCDHLTVHAWRRAMVRPALAASACAIRCIASRMLCLWAQAPRARAPAPQCAATPSAARCIGSACRECARCRACAGRPGCTPGARPASCRPGRRCRPARAPGLRRAELLRRQRGAALPGKCFWHADRLPTRPWPGPGGVQAR